MSENHLGMNEDRNNNNNNNNEDPGEGEREREKKRKMSEGNEPSVAMWSTGSRRSESSIRKSSCTPKSLSWRGCNVSMIATSELSSAANYIVISL